MKMQESKISITQGDGDENVELCGLHLCGALSEWFFATQFWTDFNRKNGTAFDQYEEESVDLHLTKAIVETLEVRMAYLANESEENIKFICRWSADGMPIFIEVSTKALLDELKCFREFLLRAVEGNLKLLFSL